MLRRIRVTLGMSQQRFADALGVARQTISDCERGAAPVPRERIMAALLLALWKEREQAAAVRLRRPFL